MLADWHTLRCTLTPVVVSLRHRNVYLSFVLGRKMTTGNPYAIISAIIPHRSVGGLLNGDQVRIDLIQFLVFGSPAGVLTRI